MNKLVRFLSVALLLATAVTHAADTSSTTPLSWKSRIYGFFVNSYTTEFAKGLSAGVFSDIVVEAASPTLTQKFSVTKDQLGQMKLVVGHAAVYGENWWNANSDTMNFQDFSLRSAGIVAGGYVRRSSIMIVKNIIASISSHKTSPSDPSIPE